MQNVRHLVRVVPWSHEFFLVFWLLLQVHGSNLQQWHQHLQGIEVLHAGLAVLKRMCVLSDVKL